MNPRNAAPIVLAVSIALFGWSAHSAAPTQQKQSSTHVRWEYAYDLPSRDICGDKDGALIKLLNRRGADGWEVVSFQAVASDGRMRLTPLDANNQRTVMSQAVSGMAISETKAAACPILFKRQSADLAH